MKKKLVTIIIPVYNAERFLLHMMLQQIFILKIRAIYMEE